MKRTLCVAFAVLGLALVSQTASAEPEWLLSGSGGLHMPMGDYADFAEMGWDAGVQLDYRVRRTFGYGADLVYNATTAKNVDVDFSIFQFGGHWTGYLPSKSGGALEPFGQLGLAFYNLKGEGPGSDESESKIGLNIGGGILIMKPTSNIGFGADATWHTVFTEGESTNFFNINGKIVFSFSDRSQR